MTTPTPSSITFVRFAALAQALLAFVLSGFFAVLTLATFVSDRADAAAGNPDEWAGLGEYLGVIASGVLLGAALLVGLPTLLLRPGRPGSRIALILGEIGTAVPIVPAAISGLNRNPYQGWVLVAAVYLALAVTCVWLLLERPARLWAADRDWAGAPTSPARDLRV